LLLLHLTNFWFTLLQIHSWCFCPRINNQNLEYYLQNLIGVDDLNKFIPEKLSVEYIDGVTAMNPVFPRRYTLTHSDSTGNLLLTIGTQYAWSKINPKRDEVLGEWQTSGSCVYYIVYLYIDQGEFNKNTSAKRMEVFKRELPLALTAIRYGDRQLFNANHTLDQATILVNFISAYPEFARQENWGAFKKGKWDGSDGSSYTDT
jgi:hypothetical protein